MYLRSRSSKMCQNKCIQLNPACTTQLQAREPSPPIPRNVQGARTQRIRQRSRCRSRWTRQAACAACNAPAVSCGLRLHSPLATQFPPGLDTIDSRCAIHRDAGGDHGPWAMARMGIPAPPRSCSCSAPLLASSGSPSRSTRGCVRSGAGLLSLAQHLIDCSRSPRHPAPSRACHSVASGLVCARMWHALCFFMND